MYWPFSIKLGSLAALAEVIAAGLVSSRPRSAKLAPRRTDLEGFAGRACVTHASLESASPDKKEGNDPLFGPLW